jgi:hypothetical protein
MTIILLRGTSRLGRTNDYLLLNWPTLDWVLPIVLLHTRVSRLVAIMLLLQFALLFNLFGILFP